MLYPNALPRFLLAVNWGKKVDREEAEKLMEGWAEFPAALDYLQLLDVQYASPIVRAFAVGKLNGMSDEQLSEVMLQLVQVLKFEPHYDTSLCRLLLRRR